MTPPPNGRPATERARVLVLAAVLLVGLTGCGSQPSEADPLSVASLTVSPSPSGTGRDPGPQAADSTAAVPSEDADPEDAISSPTSEIEDERATGRTSPSPDRSPTVNPTPQPMEVDDPDGVDLTATLDPTCVVRGQTMTITVDTEPEAAVAYHARYSGSEGGAEPPYGRGHGGNDKGFTDANGRYTSTWQVGTEAPLGPAIVDVVVAWNGKRGYDSPRFEVVEHLDAC